MLIGTKQLTSRGSELSGATQPGVSQNVLFSIGRGELEFAILSNSCGVACAKSVMVRNSVVFD